MTKVRWRVADLEQLAAKVRLFRELHAGPEMLVMANAWDAASAQRFEAAGFSAIATSSGGLAQALGYADHEQAPVEEMLASAARIVRSVSLPVTVDFESGYGLPPAEIARRLVEIGAVGLNLEDTDHEAGVLRPAEAQAERLAAVRAEARRLGAELFLNARVDVFLRREGELDTQVAEGTRRARLYREAGADCVYPLGLVDPDAIRAIVQAAGVVNVMLRRDGPLSIQTARAAGARRATYATSLFRDMMTVLNAIATEIRAAVLEQPSSAGAQVEPPMNDASAATGEPGALLREVLASVDGLRVQLVTIARGQSIPRHRHSEVSDTLVAIEGTVIVDIEGDEAAHRLRPGERLTIPSGTVHRVSGERGEACRFINLHEGGAYDFIEEDASTKHG